MVVQVSLNPEFPIEEPGSSTAGDDIATRRRLLHDKFERENSAAPSLDLARATEVPEAPREPLASVLVSTPAGEILFGPPTGISLTMRIAMMLGEKNANRTQQICLRTLMCVQAIDGQRVDPITSEVEAQYLANMLGDGVMDFLFGVLHEYWPPPNKQDLRVLSKNKRVT